MKVHVHYISNAMIISMRTTELILVFVYIIEMI